LSALLFPYRTHLEEEIIYLRGLVSQKDHRIHELQDLLAKQGTRAIVPRETHIPVIPVKIQPKGFDELRAERRKNPPEEPEAIPGAWREVQAATSGAEANKTSGAIASGPRT
jgi:hypothetical protein